ncbi:hypothetical protein KC19_6G047500 [Ceratodon purpureus]|uniref:Uncharacterized protein n=1 Tax=Ceratodon purpureus TaxID=3225 RepID=A0A8T0HAE0_CERPU|nr:hypothetical protein KC19_6G047500 [Ceratodon purpureus]
MGLTSLHAPQMSSGKVAESIPPLMLSPKFFETQPWQTYEVYREKLPTSFLPSNLQGLFSFSDSAGRVQSA